MAAAPVRIAVIGHVEHVVIARVPALPGPGAIVHLDEPLWIPGGGGGITFAQLTRSPAELHLFTAFGDDDAASAVQSAVEATSASVHAARRAAAQTRDVALLTPGGERTILVVGRPLHATLDDALEWGVLDGCRAVFFSAEDPRLLARARAAELLVVTARRQRAIRESAVAPDVIVGSAFDPLEKSTLGDYRLPPKALVMTEGARGGSIETAAGVTRFPAPPPPATAGGAYGAGDSFVGALTWYLACGLTVEDACVRAGPHGAAVLRGINPLENQLELEDIGGA
ncbi:MAG: sugar kinase [Dehalococcoidia bacterium]|nr:sugar kinase [Dehalococcoidia bacterium]